MELTKAAFIAKINSIITTNGVQAITGSVLNDLFQDFPDSVIWNEDTIIILAQGTADEVSANEIRNHIDTPTTLAYVLNINNKVGTKTITSDDGESVLDVRSGAVSLKKTSGDSHGGMSADLLSAILSWGNISGVRHVRIDGNSIELLHDLQVKVAAPKLVVETGASDDIYGLSQVTGTKELSSYMDAQDVWWGTKSVHDFLLYAGNAAASIRIKASNGRAVLEYGLASKMLLLNANKEIIHSTLSESDIATAAQMAFKADLVGGLVPSAQLPSFVDDILEYADLASFPATGETGKIYIAIDTGKQYRWTGSAYSAVTNGFIASTDDVPESATKKYVPAAVADNDFTVGVAATGGWLKKTLAEIKTILGLTFGTAGGTYAEGNDSRILPNGIADVYMTPLYFFGAFSSPVDLTTYYCTIRNVPSITQADHATKFPIGFTLIGATIMCSGNTTQGSNEDVGLYIKNITAGTSHFVGTFKTNATTAVITSTTVTGLSITVPATDQWCWQINTPTYGTKPVSCGITVLPVMKRAS